MTAADVAAQLMAGEHGDFARDAVALVARELMEAEITAEVGAELGEVSDTRAILHAERALGEQAEVSYKRMVTDQRAGRPSRKVGASATPERA
jgi:hypothetical protein